MITSDWQNKIKFTYLISKEKENNKCYVRSWNYNTNSNIM